MFGMHRIILIGTSHISPKSIEKIKQTIEKEKPGCVAVELDPIRYHALLGEQRKPSLKFGLTAFIFTWLQQELSKKTGIIPGKEMLTAIEYGKKANARIVLIDMDIRETMRRINSISTLAKIKLFFKIFVSVFSPQMEEFDLSEVPNQKIINEALKYLKQEFPEFYDILVTQRNLYMVNWIKKLSKEYKKIVVVVGAGHKKDIEKGLKWILQNKK